MVQIDFVGEQVLPQQQKISEESPRHMLLARNGPKTGCGRVRPLFDVSMSRDLCQYRSSCLVGTVK